MHFCRRLTHFDLGIHLLDLCGLLFQLRCGRLYLLLLLRERCLQVLDLEVKYGLPSSVGNGLGPDALNLAT